MALLPMSLVPLALASLFLARAPAPDVSRRFVVVASAVLTAGIALGTAAIAAGLLTGVGLPAWPAWAVVAGLLAIGFTERIRTAFAGWAEATLDREAYEARRGLVAFGRELAVESSRQAIADALLGRVVRALIRLLPDHRPQRGRGLLGVLGSHRVNETGDLQLQR